MFADLSGRRWRRTSRVLLVAVIALVLGLVLTEPAVLRSPLEPDGGDGVTAEEVGGEVVTVGSGPLVRAVRVDGRSLRDPFSGEVVGSLSDEEAYDVGTSAYALQYYGYAGGGDGPSLSLTFDDGPSKQWTRQILDVLAQYHAQATFFVTGNNLVRYPEFAQRAEREGHLVANHTVHHENLSDIRGWKQRWELVTNDRVIRAVLGHGSAYVRLPYDGGEGLDFVKAVLAAQERGYAVSTYDFDSEDWYHVQDPDAISLPPLDGQNLTVLVHDAGGDRSATITYLKRLLPAAEAAGYTFTTLETSQPVPQQAVAAAETPTLADRLARAQLEVMYVWPDHVLEALFVLAVLLVALIGLLQLVLGVVRHRRRRTRLAGLIYHSPVDVVIAAYNEAAVIERTLDSVLASVQPLRRVIVVDDGSTDGTAAVVERVQRRDSRVWLLSQKNGGKSAALNNGLTVTRTEVVVTLDADTVVSPTTIATLVRHFAARDAGTLGAVAGTVKVGNRARNLLTRWQALEYVVQIGIERAAQDSLRAISIIPGACAAWRREAILAAGGYSHDTLAEDCDLSLTLHELGYRVTQDDESVARTEAPDTVDALLKQRTRWMYGTMQAVAKHRGMILRPRYGWLGMFVLPTYILSVLVPLLFLPVVTVMTVLLVQTEGLDTVLPYFLAFLSVQVVIAVAGIRVMRESWHHLWMVPLYRIVFEPLRAYLIYVSAYTALKGVGLSWNKLARTGLLDEAPSVPAQRTASGAVGALRQEEIA